MKSNSTILQGNNLHPILCYLILKKLLENVLHISHYQTNNYNLLQFTELSSLHLRLQSLPLSNILAKFIYILFLQYDIARSSFHTLFHRFYLKASVKAQLCLILSTKAFHLLIILCQAPSALGFTTLTSQNAVPHPPSAVLTPSLLFFFFF